MTVFPDPSTTETKTTTLVTTPTVSISRKELKGGEATWNFDVTAPLGDSWSELIVRIADARIHAAAQDRRIATTLGVMGK